MFLIIEDKLLEACKVMLTTSEDEQLLQKTLNGMSDYLHITHFFDMRENFAMLIQYCCEVLPSLITLTTSNTASPQPDGEYAITVHRWKCTQLIEFLLRNVSNYATTLENVNCDDNNNNNNEHGVINE